MIFSGLAVASTQSMGSFWPLVAVGVVGYLVLQPFFRRIGGEGGGSEKEIVGVIWVLAALTLGVFLFHGAGESG